MTNQQPVQPIFILPEDTKRTRGKDAQSNNIMAAKAVAHTVRTTLGPKGMDKMIVDSMGGIIVTNDGATILKEIHIEHPAAKMIVEIAKTQEEVIGDGTTSVVVIAGELLKKAEELLEQNIHPTVIAKGFRVAERKAHDILQVLGKTVDCRDKQILANIAMTAMRGKGAEATKDILAELIVDAVTTVANKDMIVDRSAIRIEKKVGETAEKSAIIHGVVLDKEIVHVEMPRELQNAKVALLDCALEIKNTEIDAKIQITDPSKIQDFIDQEERTLKAMVNKIIDAGANVVFCQKGIDDIAQYFLGKAGILAVRRVKKSDIEALAKATGARVVSNLTEISPKDLGKAGSIREGKVGESQLIFIEKCEIPKVVTLLVRGTTEQIVDEIARAIDDAIGDLAATLRYKKAIGGAGSPEIELAQQLRKYAEEFSGREQLAVKAFADALEVIPRTLAENAGLDPINVLTELRSAHEKGNISAGINAYTGEVENSWDTGVIEPLQLKIHALASATEVAEMILRIDDVILARPAKEVPRQHHEQQMY